MYLYFDKNGVLKEIVNDEAIRQGSANYNKIYMYFENEAAFDGLNLTFVLSNDYIPMPRPISGAFPPNTCLFPANIKKIINTLRWAKSIRFMYIHLLPKIPALMVSF